MIVGDTFTARMAIMDNNVQSARYRCSCGLWRIGSHCSCQSIEAAIARAAHVPTDRAWKAEQFTPTPEVQ